MGDGRNSCPRPSTTLGMNQSDKLNGVVAEKHSKLVCVDLDSGLEVGMCGSLCSLVGQQQDFAFSTRSQ